MGSDHVLAVTTRSKLKSARFFPRMMSATMEIRRQLDGTEGLVGWASIVANPTEFFTLTAWRSRHLMQEFMRSDAHGAYMWNVSQWLESFWLMRWLPGSHQIGSWRGLELAPAEELIADTGLGDPEGHGPGRLASLAPPPDAPEVVAEDMAAHMPELYEALSPEGAASYDRAPSTRRFRRYVAGAGGAVVRIATSTARIPMALRELKKLRSDLEDTAGDRLLGTAVGVGKPHEAYLLGVFTDRTHVIELLEDDWVSEGADRWGEGFWASEWLPENEFGHWDGRRLRDAAVRRGGELFPARRG